MKYSWLPTVLPISAIFCFRMLGLFMLMPVFTIYAYHLRFSTPFLIGLALGSYGLTQGLLQIPFGALSDKIGRKPVIALGLILFALGSLLGAITNNIYLMIAARSLQGMGAIGSVLMALLADLTLEEHRLKAMAVIGATIGLSFGLSLIISPIITQHFALKGIFYFSAMLALLGLIFLYTLIKTPRSQSNTLSSNFKKVIANPTLQQLNLAIFCQHLILTATFYAIPAILSTHSTKIASHFYLSLLLSSFLLMVPLIWINEKKYRLTHRILIAVISISQLLLSVFYYQWWALCLIFLSYFTIFNFLEANLPAEVSRHAPETHRGLAMGTYSSCQFLGIFAGGLLAGLVMQFYQFKGIFIMNALIATGWWITTQSYKSK